MVVGCDALSELYRWDERCRSRKIRGRITCLSLRKEDCDCGGQNTVKR